MKLCSIIILTYNALSYTRICIESLFKYTTPFFEMIIVDNGSTDGTVNFLNNLPFKSARTGDYRTQDFSSYHSHKTTVMNKRDIKPKRIAILKNQANIGFAKGCNQAAAIAGGDTLLFLNNDTMVGKNWLDNLLHCINSSPSIAVVNPCSNFNPYAQVNVPYQGLKEIQNFINNYNKKNPVKWRESDGASGFCLLVKRVLFEQFGGFDERFEVGCYEDTDLTYRLHKAGYKIIIAGDTYVHHFGNKTFQANNLNLSQYMQDNFRRFHEKHHGE